MKRQVDSSQVPRSRYIGRRKRGKPGLGSLSSRVSYKFSRRCRGMLGAPLALKSPVVLTTSLLANTAQRGGYENEALVDYPFLTYGAAPPPLLFYCPLVPPAFHGHISDDMRRNGRGIHITNLCGWGWTCRGALDARLYSCSNISTCQSPSGSLACRLAGWLRPFARNGSGESRLARWRRCLSFLRCWLPSSWVATWTRPAAGLRLPGTTLGSFLPGQRGGPSVTLCTGAHL